MNIFNNFDNIPFNYVPNNSNNPPNILCNHPIRPLELYNAKGQFIGFSWHHCDTVLLEFCTKGTVEYDNGTYVEAGEYLEGKEFIISFYNFRYETIFCDTCQASDHFAYYIDKCLSSKLIPGVYYICVTLVDRENKIKQTLIDYDECRIIVR